MPKAIEKRFPADTSLAYEHDEAGTAIKISTFLNDPKVDAELYAYFLSLSIGENQETRVYKDKLPTQEYITKEILRYKSRSTYNTHLKYLKDQGYIVDKGKYYLIPHKERMYFKMPLDLLQFFVDTIKEPVLKTYIYLGQRNSYKPKEYIFTIKEIADHLGINYQRNCTSIKNYLELLVGCGLITIQIVYQDKKPYMKLIDFNTSVPNVIK